MEGQQLSDMSGAMRDKIGISPRFKQLGNGHVLPKRVFAAQLMERSCIIVPSDLVSLL